MRVLIACEESQRVCIEFRRLGHIAYSCDIQGCSGEHPEWHIVGDALSVVNGRCDFITEDGQTHHIEGKWDLLIAHPPCTYLSNAGTRHFSLKCNSVDKVAERIRKREDAFNLFMAFINADCDRIAVENPVGFPNTMYRKADQIIHPYYFTDTVDSEDYELKRTCLWLKNLPLLQRTNCFDKPQPKFVDGSGKNRTWTDGVARGSKERSKTFHSIAKAMAEQWGVLMTDTCKSFSKCISYKYCDDCPNWEQSSVYLERKERERNAEQKTSEEERKEASKQENNI